MAALDVQRINTLVSRHLGAVGPPEEVERAVAMELVSYIRKGLGEHVLGAIKEPFKHGVPQMQLRSIVLLDHLVASTTYDFATLLVQEDWRERIFKIAKTTPAEAVSDRVIMAVLGWHKRYPMKGTALLVDRFEKSKVIGDKFIHLKGEWNRQQLRGAAGGSFIDPHSQSLEGAQRGSSSPSGSRPRAQPDNRRSRANLDTLLQGVQGDMSGLEYGIQHPNMLDESTATDCAAHHTTLNKLLDDPAHIIGDDDRRTVLALLEQLENLLSFYDAIAGTSLSARANPRSAPSRSRDQSASEESPAARDADDDAELQFALKESIEFQRRSGGGGPAAATEDDDAQPLGLSLRGPSNTFVPAAEMESKNRQVGDLTTENSTLNAKIRGLAAEKAAAEKDLQEQMDAYEALQKKYSSAKSKNKEAVAAAEELERDLEQAQQRVASLEAAIQEKHAAPPPPPEIREVVRTVKPTVDAKVVRRVHAQVSATKKDLQALRRDGRHLSTVAGEFVAELNPRIAQIVDAAVNDRHKDAQELKHLQTLYKREVQRRKEYYNQLQELKGNIRVYCRFRPMSETELKNGHTDIATFPTDDEVRVIDKQQRVKSFEFDTVFGPDSTQEGVFADTMPLIDSVVDGYNVCIFAYGQTGSGKTHTMNGSPDKPGINRRALQRLFDVIQERESTETCQVRVSVLEIYNDEIRDLLVPSKQLAKSYDIHPNGKFGSYVSNLSEEEVKNADAINDIMNRASSNRTEGKTNMNAHSSRSHMVVYILITTENKTTHAQSYGKLSLVDLAGSERLDKSGAEGAAAKEAVSINKSLTALGDTISSLSQGAKHVPYRNSTLTHLLQDSMSGQAKVLMFCCASPASYNTQETVSSLSFALRARGVSLGKVKKNG